MIPQPLSILDHLHALDPDARAEVVWWVSWHTAWDWCAAQGHCDDYGSHEYRRITCQALSERLQPYQTTMRAWITARCRTPSPVPFEETP